MDSGFEGTARRAVGQEADSVRRLSPTNPPAGAYGLTLLGLERATSLLPAPGPHWPEVRVEQEELAGEPGPSRVTEARAELRLLGGGQVDLDRHRRIATFRTPSLLDDDELAHPYLAAVGSYFAGWLGREALHAGAFVAGDGAWALAGAKEGGKSTTLAWLALAGVPVLTDDILVLDSDTALAGPRCVDLRDESAAALGLAGKATASRGGERWRLSLPPIEPEVAVRGLVFLAWGEGLELRPLPPADRLLEIAARRNAHASPEPAGLLDLARLPAFELRRPRAWDALPEACSRLLALAAG
jgi:hypothetical protein